MKAGNRDVDLSQLMCWRTNRIPLVGSHHLMIAYDTKAGEVDRVVRTFRANLDVCLSLSEVVFEVFQAGSTYGETRGWASSMVLGQYPWKGEDQQAGQHVIAEHHSQILQTVDSDSLNCRVPSLFIPDRIPDELAPSIIKLMSMQLILLWSAFENLAADFWEESVNYMPDPLANGPKSKRYSFARLSDIRLAFGETFCHDALIDQSLANPVLDVLSAVRNVIVHRGGVVDEKYLALASNLPLAPTAVLDQPLSLRGEWVTKVVNESTECMLLFVSAVDKWIHTEQTSRAKSSNSPIM